MRTLAFAMAALFGALLATSASAQTVTKDPPSQRAVTPADMERRLADEAARVKAIAPSAARIALVDFAWPVTAAELNAMGKFIVVLVVAVSQDEQELPLKRVYVRSNGRIVELQKIASVRHTMSDDPEIAATLGRFREDSFYAAPAGAMMRKGDLLIDFAINRSGFRVYELPGTPPAFVRADRHPDPAPGAKPDVKAMQALIEREYPGFDVPVEPR